MHNLTTATESLCTPRITRTDNVSERITPRKDGSEKVERISFGDTGRNIHDEAARGHWKLYGYRKNGKFSRTAAGLKVKLHDT